MRGTPDSFGPTVPEPVTTIVDRVLNGLVVDYAGVLTDPDAADLFAVIDELRDRGVRTALLSVAAGMTGVHHTSVEATLTELSALFPA